VILPVPTLKDHTTIDPGVLPDAPISSAVDHPRTQWLTAPVPLPDMVAFRGKKGDHAYDPIILRAARDNGLDPAVIKALIMAESGFNPQAVSRAGAQGLMQLMPRTAGALDVENPLDPQANIIGGTRYLKWLLQRFDGDIERALAAYNAGSRHVRKHNGIPPFKATRRYLAKIKIYHQYYQKEGFSLASYLVSTIPTELNPFSTLNVARCLSLFPSI
jgi:soluble lytic murein transglycosylase-like protein